MGILSGLFAGGAVTTSPNTAGLSDFWFSELGAQSKAGVNITPDSALSISSVYQGVRLMSMIVGMLPKHVHRRLGKGKTEVDRDHELNRILRRRPNRTQTPIKFYSQMNALAMLHGDAFAEIRPGEKPKGGRSWRSELVPLRSNRMTVEQLSGGRVRFRYKLSDGTERVYNQDQILHLSGFGLEANEGDKPTERFKETAGLSLAAEEFGARQFSGDNVPRIALRTDGRVTNKAAIADSWRQAYGGLSNAGKVAILEDGLDIKQLSIDNDKAQHVQLRKFLVNEWSRWLNVSPHMLSDLERAIFNNVEHMGISLVMYQLMPHVVTWEETLNRDLLTEEESEELFIKINVDGLVRGDLETRTSAYDRAIQTGWMTRNEVREKENMNPLDGLDEMLQPLNMKTVGEEDDDEKPPAGGAPPPQAPPAVPPPPAPVDQGDGAAAAMAHDDPAAVAHARMRTRAMALAKSAASRVLAKERAQITKWAERKSADASGWERVVAVFYSKHAPFVAEALSMPRDRARAYCEEQQAELLRAGVGVVERWGEERELELMDRALEPEEVTT